MRPVEAIEAPQRVEPLRLWEEDRGPFWANSLLSDEAAVYGHVDASHE